MILLSIYKSSLLHAVKKSRGQKDPRVQQKHCSSVTQSDLKNLLNKKCMYLFIRLFILFLGQQSFQDQPSDDLHGSHWRRQASSNSQSSLLTASPHRFSGDIQSIINTA